LLLCCGDVGKLKFRQILPQLVFCAFQADITLELTGGGKAFQQFDGSRYILFERFPTLLSYQLMRHRVRVNLILLSYFLY
jgi:hypothetical protein